MAHANTLISMAMPFGSPIDTELSRITAITTVGFGPGTLDQKVRAHSRTLALAPRCHADSCDTSCCLLL